MLLVEEKRVTSTDFKQYSDFLLQSARLLNAVLEIRTLEGEIIISSCSSDTASAQSITTNDREQIRAECFDLFRKMEKTRKTEVWDNIPDLTMIASPLFRNHEIAGVLISLGNRCSSSEADDVTAFIEAMAKRISSEMQSSYEIDNIAEELSEKYEELNLIYNLGKNLVNLRTAQSAFEFITRQLQETFNADIALGLIPEKDMYEVRYGDDLGLASRIKEDFLIYKIFKLLSEKFGSSDACFPYIVVDDAAMDQELSRLARKPMTMLAASVKAKDRIAGYLCIINVAKKKIFQTGDAKLLISLAEQMAMVMNNAELYENMKGMMLNVVRSLVYSLEAKDSYTSGHSERVNRMTMMIGDALGISNEERDALNWASILHDIGKIGVPEGILTKPGKLTDEEFDLIRLHPEKGYSILAPIDQLKDSLNGIRHHHERIDGNGYPKGLSGDDIPLHARIIAIADTYDAMTSSRPYRKGRSHEEALAEIRRVKGTQLDAALVDLSLELFREQPPFAGRDPMLAG